VNLIAFLAGVLVGAFLMFAAMAIANTRITG
jgi:hypothetical protein